MPYAPSTTVVALALEYPCWLFAHTCRINGAASLLVYRSPALPEDDAWYAPVARFLAEFRPLLIARQTVRDVGMMFSRAVVEHYRLPDGCVTDALPNFTNHRSGVDVYGRAN